MKPHEIVFFSSVFFLAGICAASLSVSGWVILILTAGLSGGFFIIGEYGKSRRLRFLVVIVWFAIIGSFYFHFRESLAISHIPLNREMTFTAEVAGYPETRGQSQFLRVWLSPPLSGEAEIYVRLYPQYGYGDRIRVVGLIRKTGFRYIVRFPEIELLAENRGSRVYAGLFKIKSGFISSLRKNLPVSKAGFAIAMLLGDTSLLAKDFKEALRKTGTSHLVALSGYNILIIVNSIQLVFSAAGLKRRSFLLVVLFASVFILMTGAAASTVRAGIMAMLMILARQNSRMYSVKNPIVFTAFLMILINPRFLVFDLGFQLSFLALIGIVCFAPFFKKRLKIKDKGLFGWKENALQTLSAEIAVAPLLIWKMGGFSVFSIIPNVLVLEAVPLIMLFGFLTIGYGTVVRPFAIMTGWILALLLAYAEGVSIFLLIWANIFVFAEIWDLRLVSLAPTIYFFDVGQGDSEMIDLLGAQFLIDGGPDKTAAAELERVMPRTDRYIDIVIITHPNSDHLNGILEVLKSYDAGIFFYAAPQQDNPALREALVEMEKSRVPVIALNKGDKVRYAGAELLVLSPGKTETSNDINDLSLVIQFKSGLGKALFMGDVGSAVEKKLMKKYDLRSEILKIGHHGSKYSSGQEFLRAVQPVAAIIEVGKNSYGHPAAKVLDNLTAVAAKVFRTDRTGTVKAVFAEEGLKIMKFHDILK